MLENGRGGDASEDPRGNEDGGDARRLATRAEGLRRGADAFARSAERAAAEEPAHADALARLTEELRSTADEAARRARDLENR